MKEKITAYEQVTREKIDNIEKEINALKDQFSKFDERTTQMFNHTSNRLPFWATIIITLLSSATIGMSVALLKGG